MLNNLDNKSWIIPWGSVEYHGPHLPLLTDSIIANYISLNVSEKIDAKVIKPLNTAVCFHMKDFPGTQSFSEKEVILEFKKIISNSSKNKIKSLYIIIGHGENVNLLPSIFELCKQNYDLEIFPFYIYDERILEIIRKYTYSSRIFNIVHGGEIETSLMLEIQENLVYLDNDMTSIYPSIKEDYWTEHYDIIPLGTFSSKGYFGDPMLASKKKGRKFLEIIIEDFLNIFQLCK